MKDLQEEIKKRNELPQKKENICCTKLVEICEEYIRYVSSCDYNINNNYNTLIADEALEAIYGEKIFNYRDNKIE